jgi:O-antigen ligase
MNTHVSQYGERAIPARARNASTPSIVVEYGFYLYMFYSLLGGVFGLFVNNLASGLLVLLVLLCVYEMGFQAMTVMKLVAFPMGCGIAYVFIHLFFFEAMLTETVRAFLIWMVLLFLVQMLALRKDFLSRFVLVMFVIGLVALPYMKSYESATETGAMQRVLLDKAIGFGSTNAMAEWYGFCAVYFMLQGWIARTNTIRNVSWLSAIMCLYVVALTVSRGALLAVGVAMLVATRQLLKKQFLPLVMALCLGWIVLALGLFDEAIRNYSGRGTEETGRLIVWPLIVDSFLDSPLIGVGDANVGAVTERGTFITPHNSFLYIAQTSGIVPLALFIAYWIRSSRSALQAEVGKSPGAIVYFPLIAYSFVTSTVGNFTFMQLSVIVSLAIPLAASAMRQAVDGPVRDSRTSMLNRGL